MAVVNTITITKSGGTFTELADIPPLSILEISDVKVEQE